MTKKFNKPFIIGLLVILICSTVANNLVLLLGEAGDTQRNQANNRAVVGPKQLLNNSDFSQVSDWVRVEPWDGTDCIIMVLYDNLTTPENMFFIRAGQIDSVPFEYNAYIRQNFTKPIWTPDYPTAVVCSLDYIMAGYSGTVGGSPLIDCEIWLLIKDAVTETKVGEWPIAAGNTGQNQKYTLGSDTRIGKWQDITLNVGSSQTRDFSIAPSGKYEFIIKVQLVCLGGIGTISSGMTLIFDNVTLFINDVHEPIVVVGPSAKNNTFGPYNADPINMIDVDFFAGGSENTSLNVGKFRLNNSGTPGTWNNIFENQFSYTKDWNITPIWADDMVEGENIIDVKCVDDVGNYNDSIQIKVIKDTVAPVTNASELDEYYTVKEFNIPYTATDQTPTGGYNNTVELWFKYNEKGNYVQYKPPWQANGFFNESQIVFNVTHLGSNYGEGKYEFHTIGVDNATNHEPVPLQSEGPDAATIVDYSRPTSEVRTLPETIDEKTFDIDYEVSDTGSDIDYVELWYLLEGQWNRWNGSNNEDGNFTESPISFTTNIDGTYGFLTVAHDKAGNIELGGIPDRDNVPPTAPDTTTQVDTQAPSPIFIAPPPQKSHIRGKETIKVTSDLDTNSIEFYYWIDADTDGEGDDNDDVNSKWMIIKKLTKDPEESESNWSTEWNTADFVRYPEFEYEEHMVVLKARGTDELNKTGEGFKRFIEVDNIPPVITITNPKAKIPENEDYMTITYESDNNDTVTTRFYWGYYEEDIEETDWELIVGKGLINGDFSHPTGEFVGSYNWEIPFKLQSESATVSMKVEAVDDTGNVGEGTVGPIYIKRLGPEILTNFPTYIMLTEDFVEKERKYTEYETHSNPEYTADSDNLLWYVTGNSETIFYLTGDYSTGANGDTFLYTSIQDRYGTENLTFHLLDPLKLEATIEQTVVVLPVNDPPKLNFPSETFQVTYGIEDTIDFSLYISDVDNNITDLVMTVDDPEYIRCSGLNLTFTYPASMDGIIVLVPITVSDSIDTTSGNIHVLITANHRPKWVKEFPSDVELKENEPLENFIDLDEYFSDEDGDTLYFSLSPSSIYTPKKVKIIINDSNEVTFEATQNVEGIEKVWFRARDGLGAFADGFMVIRIINIPDPPVIKSIPDMNIHWSEEGYRYDFSYFIYDPDNDRSELDIWVTTGEEEQNEWFENDPNNNMIIIFKFPFSAVDETYHLALYVADPDHKQNYQIFNVTVITDSWPVEQIRPIPSQEFLEDKAKKNAFYLDIGGDNYFEDRDGGTNFKVLDHQYIKAEIDAEGYVDLSSKVKDWNTGESYTELWVLAGDTMPEQQVYALVKVYVRPVNDAPILDLLPLINVTIGEEKTLDLKDYIDDVDTPISSLVVESADLEHVKVSGTLLIIKYDTIGIYTVEIRIKDIDHQRSQPQILTINVKEKPTREQADLGIAMYGIVGLIIIIIIIFVVLLLVFTNYKVKEVFLIHKSGILLSHLSRERKPGRDDEILSGMFTAVQEFIKDSFSTTGPPGAEDDHVLKEMKIGEHNNILIERGQYIYLAVIFSGRGAGKLRNKVSGILNSIEKHYEQSFKSWVGDMDKIKGVERFLKPLLPTGGIPVITDKQLGRVPAPQPTTPATVIGRPPRAQLPPTAARRAITPTPAKPITPIRAAAVPARAVAARPAAPAAGVHRCPKCGAVPNRFPDGSILCPKCGYTGK